MPRRKQIIPDVPVYDPQEVYYSSKELAALLRVSIHTIAKWRRKGCPPKYIIVGYRSRRYAKTEVLQFIKERTRTSTSATQNYDLHP